ncbi:hypothetical protein [Chitinimonas sp. BJB300]|uniref:hypothetical protein n=1 Tax=Chitinimonas sp. BJB300 TaxID=1559339 RepID=UPI000C107552|nr:hypothetical protein [Chitinimonas sp. BJB300]PHV12886.1 hypothetical protein CSQ89_03595 [Chitinimonas sp. BJB300]TSJ86081.1 hypothetical protein FG002_016245 [Chitinimonas sp. BJB300]
MFRYLLLPTLIAVCITTLAAECKIHDLELQGTYTGGCNRDGWAEGYGVTESDIARYEGEFHAGRKHGLGVKTWAASGDEYRGHFDSDFRQGWGRYVWGPMSKWPNEVFEGEFVQDKRQGYGAYFWPSGDKFQGQWKDDMRYGKRQMEMQR